MSLSVHAWLHPHGLRSDYGHAATGAGNHLADYRTRPNPGERVLLRIRRQRV